MYMRFKALLLGLFLVGEIAACDLVNPNEVDYRAQALAETKRREDLWKALNIHDYDFKFQRACACSDKATQPVTIHVRNDAIARILDSTGAVVSPSQDIPWPTVDSLYSWTRRFLNNKNFAVQVEFDTTFQFPQTITGEDPGRSLTKHVSTNFVQQPPGTPAMRLPD